MKTIVGWSVWSLMDPEKHPELTARIEVGGREQFSEKWGVPITEELWRHHPAHIWTDPETREEIAVPDQWCFIVEGVRDDGTG